MAIVKRKDGRFAVVYPLNGKQKWESFGKGLDAKKKAHKRNEELKEQGLIRGYKKQSRQIKTPTFETLALEYMDAKALTLTKSSIDNIFYKLKGVILPELGHLPVNRINAERLRKYAKKRLKSPVTKRIGPRGNRVVPVKNPDGTIKTISTSTVHRELSDIIAILNWSVKQEYIIENPVKNFEKPKRDDEIILPPTIKEIEQIIAHAADHLVRALLLAFYTGLRPGDAELFHLTWVHINLEKNNEWVHIISAKKGGLTERYVPAHPDLIPYLGKWKQEDIDNNAGNLPIIRWKNKPVKSVKKAFAAAKHRAGITRRIRMYDFRHAFASTMLKKGGDLKSTSEMLDHSRPDTTTNIYQHTDIGMHRKNIVLLPGLKLE